MAVLVAVAIPTVASITGSAKEAVQDTNCRTIESVIKLAEAEASKTGNSVADLTQSQVQTAIENAKLGIESGTYVYDNETGNCTFGGTADSVGDFTIEFGTGEGFTNGVKVTEKAA